jgi:protein KTI12
MPLVLLTGYPCSGKSKRVAELKKYLEESKGQTVRIIDDDVGGIDRQTTYEGRTWKWFLNQVTNLSHVNGIF